MRSGGGGCGSVTANESAIARHVVPIDQAKEGDLVWDEKLERPRPLGRFHVKLRLPDGTVRLLYNPQERQDQLHACPKRNILYGGQAGGGKSHGLRWHGIINCLRHPNLRVLLLRLEFTDLEKSHLIDLRTEVPDELASYNAGQHRLNFPNGSLMQFGHCHDMKALKAYLSSQWDLILIDEASLFPPEYLRLLRTRLRTTNRRIRPQFVLATNPGGQSHLWIKQRFITKKPPADESRQYNPDDWEYIPSALEDNAYLDPAEYEMQFSELSEAEYKAYRKGDWDSFAGQFFTEWERRLHVVPWDTEIPDWWEVAAGMDWGYAPHPGYVGWAAIDPYGRVWGYKELVFREMSGKEVAAAIVAMCETEMERRMTIYGDTQMWTKQPQTGVSIADEMNEAFAELGVQIVLVQANKDRINGWHRMHQYLRPIHRQPETGKPGPFAFFLDAPPHGREGEMAVPRGCPYLIETIGSQLHDEKKPGDLLKGATDHGCDGWRYFFITRQPLTVIPPQKKPPVPHERRVHNRTRELLARAMARANRENAPVLDDPEGMLEGDPELLREDGGDALGELSDAWN
jgi:phage terminase large subunit